MKEIEAYFRYLRTIGVEFVEPGSPLPRPVLAQSAAVSTAPPLPASPPVAAALEVIAREAAACTACGLHKTRTQTVFADGNPATGLMFVGEAPGADEDEQGKPFVGRAGQLLTKMIEAIGFRREDVYIANVLKCRPPKNRDPLPDEVAACEGFLKRQIAVARPAIICALGAHAAHTLLREETPIGRMRGRIYDYEGVPLLATYHPSFLLRSPGHKKEAWEDLQKLRDEYWRLKKKPDKG
ncbi:MAG: uracil-DNA glycosylase [Nitrospinae bacterium]|nr:uracil-DNA glycosylase [Nitrospinota bacterium]